MQEMWAPSLGGEDPPEEEMATHSSILAWKISWTEEPGGIRKRVRWSRSKLKVTRKKLKARRLSNTMQIKFHQRNSGLVIEKIQVRTRMNKNKVPGTL